MGSGSSRFTYERAFSQKNSVELTLGVIGWGWDFLHRTKSNGILLKGAFKWNLIPQKNASSWLAGFYVKPEWVIADFDYNLDSHGRSYGWGVARYTTPEALYGSLLVNSASHSSPEASYAKLKQTLQTAFPDVPEKTLDKFLK